MDHEGRSGYDYSDYISNGFMNRYANSKFKETLGEYVYNISDQFTYDEYGYDNNELLKQRKKHLKNRNRLKTKFLNT